jgi:hypothetical protein
VIYMAKPFKSYKSNNSMSWGGLDNFQTQFEPMKLGGTSNSNLAMQKKLKPIWSKDSGLPKYYLPLQESEKNIRSGQGIQFSLSSPTTPNAVKAGGTSSNSFPVGTTWSTNDGPKIKGGIQTSTGYIMEDTLFKPNKFGYTGADTIAGMSEQYITTTEYEKPQPQENPSLQFAGTMENVIKNNLPIEKKIDTLVRGSNYANINYPGFEYKDMKTKAAEKKAAEAHQAARDKLSVLLPHIESASIEIDPKPPKDDSGSSGSGNIDTGRPDGLTYSVKTNTGSKASKRAKRLGSAKQTFMSSPLQRSANSIQAKLGRSPVTFGINRYCWTMKYGGRACSKRYTIVNWTNPATKIVTDYNKKNPMNTWAKTINPEHASVVSDRIENGKTIKNYANKGDEMDAIYDKVIKKTKENKTKYKTFYDTVSGVEDFNYYTVGDEDFAAFKEHKDYLLGDISYRRSNQKEIIDRLKLDAKTIEQKDRSESIIPKLESDIDTLDTKSTIIKKQIGEHDWQKGISQDAFGTDTIQGESHVSGVLDSYGGQVRGGNYYAQDVGHLIKNTKEYESELKTEIKQQTSEIESIEPDSTEALVDYFNDKSNKENAIASKDYLTKSLELTKEDRIKLERAREASAYGANQQASIARPKQSRGKPNPRKSSSQGGGQYKNTRTRGGQNNLGGLVI